MRIYRNFFHNLLRFFISIQFLYKVVDHSKFIHILSIDIRGYYLFAQFLRKLHRSIVPIVRNIIFHKFVCGFLSLYIIIFILNRNNRNLHCIHQNNSRSQSCILASLQSRNFNCYCICQAFIRSSYSYTRCSQIRISFKYISWVIGNLSILGNINHCTRCHVKNNRLDFSDSVSFLRHLSQNDSWCQCSILTSNQTRYVYNNSVGKLAISSGNSRGRCFQYGIAFEYTVISRIKRNRSVICNIRQNAIGRQEYYRFHLSFRINRSRSSLLQNNRCAHRQELSGP